MHVLSAEVDVNTDSGAKTPGNYVRPGTLSAMSLQQPMPSVLLKTTHLWVHCRPFWSKNFSSIPMADGYYVKHAFIAALFRVKTSVVWQLK